MCPCRTPAWCQALTKLRAGERTNESRKEPPGAPADPGQKATREKLSAENGVTYVMRNKRVALADKPCRHPEVLLNTTSSLRPADAAPGWEGCGPEAGWEAQRRALSERQAFPKVLRGRQERPADSSSDSHRQATNSPRFRGGN